MITLEIVRSFSSTHTIDAPASECSVCSIYNKTQACKDTTVIISVDSYNLTLYIPTRLNRCVKKVSLNDIGSKDKFHAILSHFQNY